MNNSKQDFLHGATSVRFILCCAVATDTAPDFTVLRGLNKAGVSVTIAVYGFFSKNCNIGNVWLLAIIRIICVRISKYKAYLCFVSMLQVICLICQVKEEQLKAILML